MPSCPYGARPTATAQNIQVWADRLSMAQQVRDLIARVSPWTYAALVAQLLDVNAMCEENLDPPSAFTVEDLVELAATIPLFGTLGSTRAVQKAYQWMRYQQFLTYCECIPAPVVPGENCASIPASFTIGSLGSIAGPWSVAISQAVMDAILVFENGSWTWFRSGSATVDGGAHDGNNLDIQVQATTGAWITVDDIQTLNLFGGICNSRNMAAVTPRFAANTFVRLVNNAGGTHTVTNMAYCFCAPVVAPKPLPVQDPLVNVPSAPSQLCENIDLCLVVQQLQKSLLNLATQISDIQAAVTGRDQLQVLATQPISGEGEITLALGTRAVSVELTALGDEAFTSALGRPRGLMRVGSIRYGDGIGYSFRRFIDADRFDDPVPPGALSLSWQLLPGTTGTLRFLG